MQNIETYLIFSGAIFRKIECNSFKNLISGRHNVEEIPEMNSYFQGNNSGSHLYPNDTTANFVLYNYILIGKLIKDYSFLNSVNQRKSAMHIKLDVLVDYEPLFQIDTCEEGHSIKKIERMFVWISKDALLNIFCSKENDK